MVISEVERAYRFQDSPHLCSQPEPCGQLMESPNQGFWSCFYLNFRNAYELNSNPREAKGQGFSEDVSSNFNRNSYKPSSYPEHDSSKSRSPDFLCHLYLSFGKQLILTKCLFRIGSQVPRFFYVVFVWFLKEFIYTTVLSKSDNPGVKDF